MIEPAKKISPPLWMQDGSPAHKIMQVLNIEEKHPMALFVGGCVRNTLLGKPVSDIDIATRHTPQAVQELLEATGIQSIPTGLQHGTITAVIEKQNFEITTLRQDVETDGRHAVVSYTDDWRIDAQRRDFTMNTLLADVHGNIYDPLGQGLKDLSNKHVVFVGDAAGRIQEDYLRILRYFRFFAYYGEGQPDIVALEACGRHANKITTLSKERITSEFIKILDAETALSIVNLMLEYNVLVDIINKDFLKSPFEDLVRWSIKNNTNCIELKLLIVCGFNPAVLKKSLSLTNSHKKNIDALMRLYKIGHKNVINDYKRHIYRFGKYVICGFIMAFAENDKIATEIVTEIDGWSVPKLPINGHDVSEHKNVTGKALGDLLRSVESWWIEKDFEPNRDACLKYLQSL